MHDTIIMLWMANVYGGLGAANHVGADTASDTGCRSSVGITGPSCNLGLAVQVVLVAHLFLMHEMLA
jgi:hypothetical protein